MRSEMRHQPVRKSRSILHQILNAEANPCGGVCASPELDTDEADVVSDIAIMDAASAEVLSTAHFPSSKEYPASSTFTNDDDDDFSTLDHALWCDPEVLAVDSFIDQYSIYG